MTDTNPPITAKDFADYGYTQKSDGGWVTHQAHDMPKLFTDGHEITAIEIDGAKCRVSMLDWQLTIPRANLMAIVLDQYKKSTLRRMQPGETLTWDYTNGSATVGKFVCTKL